MLGSLAALPAVEAESIATPGTWTGLGMRDRVLYECGRCYKGGLYLPIGSDLVYEHAVSDGFFAALGVPVIDGRVFDADDRMDSARVAVVNQSFARQGFEGGKPIGKHIRLGDITGKWYRIIGVVRDIPPRGVGAPRKASPAVYVSALQVPPRSVGITVRTPGEPDAVAPMLEAAIRRVEPTAEVGPVTSLQSELDRPVAPLRWLGILFSVLAALALALAAYGMHAAMRNLVEARRREIAIRMAIGAGATRIVGLVFRHALRLGTAGAIAGLFCALVTGRVLQLRFTGIPMFDAALTGRVALVLAATLVAGAVFPARRATRVHPHAALQEE
jgi:putative ABC transport system permease protein